MSGSNSSGPASARSAEAEAASPLRWTVHAMPTPALSPRRTVSVCMFVGGGGFFLKWNRTAGEERVSFEEMKRRNS